MKTPTTWENICEKFRHFVYKCVKSAYLWSIKKESLDDYIEDLLLAELVYSDGSFAVETLEEYLASGDGLWKELPEHKKKLENLIAAIKAMNVVAPL